MDHTICHFEIPVDDMDKAGKFYQGLFGWQIQPWGEPEVGISMVGTVPADENGAPARQGVNGMLIKKRHPQQPFANYISVESVDDYAAKAVALGGQIALPKTPVPGMGYFLYIKDLDGNILGLWELDPSAGSA
jgi:predicted enzyme related to lactoylglutathione lyase